MNDAETESYGRSDVLKPQRTRAGNPLKVKLPDDAGNYEIRYISRKTRDILAREDVLGAGLGRNTGPDDVGGPGEALVAGVEAVGGEPFASRFGEADEDPFFG